MTMALAIYGGGGLPLSLGTASVNTMNGHLTIEASNPLPATSITQAALPITMDVQLAAVDSITRSPDIAWQAQNIATGIAAINLDGDYRLLIDEMAGSLTIHHGQSGAVTHIWGAVDLLQDQTGALRFWADMTFTLRDNTKITVQTAAASDHPDLYILERVVITKNYRAVIITGVGNATRSDLAIDSNFNGRLEDLVTADGYIVRENSSGTGWVQSATGEAVSQVDLDKTAPDGEYGPSRHHYSLDDVSRLFNRFLNNSAASLGYSLTANADIRHESNSADQNYRLQEILAAKDRSQVSALQNTDQLTG
ncbi:DUF1521 domain-containing protein [Parasphingorhabdus cellanae]|uniref:DUF1521 domain-containing protein n=1 Tax=Parasphingorhabdus cellanae TaxID=2806553 RepID=A0ABX7T872_9SPHN|nr:DUF1521 domain-containing protein [Parasphingorhabdus cellanae]QTD56143.1 DUF1521 domain-containing protein [Parasphingorhabdus cellanae]